ncbi:MAG: secreted protein [Microbacteriaceae bacterium]|nr:secreted protein [Microbacteriaceae bacterium]
MALFTTDNAAPPRQGPRIRRFGWILLAVAIIGTVLFSMAHSPYVIEQPGPVFDTLGNVQTDAGKSVPLIDITGAPTYPTAGNLDMLTVNVVGNRQESPSWLDVAGALIDPSKAVLPLDSVYPAGETVQQSNQQSAVDMQNSQRDAVAAALTQLGYTLPVVLTVGGLSEGSPSAGILKTGDVVVSINGETPQSVVGMRAIIAKTGAGKPVTVVYSRAGEVKTVDITPQLSNDPTPVPIIGIFPAISYTFPFDVKIQLENVGGPSAGQMLALGIIDKLTTGELNGGKKVAGTGTIDIDGNVGRIGGIRQKLYGARDAGATWFLAPFGNCNEVTGHVPSGIHVLAVKTLKDSLVALTAISKGGSTSGLLACPAK